MSHQYADLDQLIQDLLPGSVGNDDEKAAIGRVLEGVSDFIDRYTRRRPAAFVAFDPESGYVVKRIRGEGFNFLRMPYQSSLNSVSRVSINESLALGVDYYVSSRGWVYFTDPGRIFVEDEIYLVSARWGYPETPAAIVEAARQLTLRLWETQRGIFGQLTPSGIVIERALPPWVEITLREFRPRQGEIV